MASPNSRSWVLKMRWRPTILTWPAAAAEAPDSLHSVSAPSLSQDSPPVRLKRAVKTTLSLPNISRLASGGTNQKEKTCNCLLLKGTKVAPKPLVIVLVSIFVFVLFLVFFREEVSTGSRVYQKGFIGHPKMEYEDRQEMVTDEIRNKVYRDVLSPEKRNRLKVMD